MGERLFLWLSSGDGAGLVIVGGLSNAVSTNRRLLVGSVGVEENRRMDSQALFSPAEQAVTLRCKPTMKTCVTSRVRAQGRNDL